MLCLRAGLHPVDVLGSPKELLSKDTAVVFAAEPSAPAMLPKRQRGRVGKGFRAQPGFPLCLGSGSVCAPKEIAQPTTTTPAFPIHLDCRNGSIQV